MKLSIHLNLKYAQFSRRRKWTNIDIFSFIISSGVNLPGRGADQLTSI